MPARPLSRSRSGYLQRCLVKNLEALRVAYDGSVRDACDGSGEDKGPEGHQPLPACTPGQTPLGSRRGATGSLLNASPPPPPSAAAAARTRPAVVQFHYGEDGLDVTQSAYMKQFGFMATNVKGVEAKYDPAGSLAQAPPQPGDAAARAAADKRQVRPCTALPGLLPACPPPHLRLGLLPARLP